MGIALYPDDGEDVDALLLNAEKAMRHTKSKGINNYLFYSKSMHSAVLEILTLENDLHRALERNELVLYYQPKVNAATRIITGMEALIRWNHPEKGLIPPHAVYPHRRNQRSYHAHRRVCHTQGVQANPNMAKSRIQADQRCFERVEPPV
jgi:predicted signal transduction protein with EAL and GGDEF domain